MSENFKHTTGSASQSSMDVPAQLQKIQQHLIFLEKKIDTLIAGQVQVQAQGQRGSFPRKDFSRPRRSFGQTEGGFNRERRPEGRRDFQGGGRPNRSFGQRSFGGDRSERSERPERAHGPEKRKFFGGKKPFPRRGRD